MSPNDILRHRNMDDLFHTLASQGMDVASLTALLTWLQHSEPHDAPPTAGEVRRHWERSQCGDTCWFTAEDCAGRRVFVQSWGYPFHVRLQFHVNMYPVDPADYRNWIACDAHGTPQPWPDEGIGLMEDTEVNGLRIPEPQLEVLWKFRV